MIDTRQNLGLLLLMAFRWFDEGLLEALNRAGWPEIGRPESMVFANLDRSGTRISELARRSGVSRQAAHQVVQGLRRAGLVELVGDPANRSARLVRPTARGERSITFAEERLLELEEALIERLGPDRVTCLRRALEADWGAVPMLRSLRRDQRGAKS